ncbi:hypothetical protein NC651_030884 [Populus alba x Populus x berolinensis]|nr:hypothetical protein NC651_030884 [Populus alba x Populus x berolinensis]
MELNMIATDSRSACHKQVKIGFGSCSVESLLASLSFSLRIISVLAACYVCFKAFGS